ncbi:MAG: hypothetical protein WKG52_01030 [Variovorax sp.]
MITKAIVDEKRLATLQARAALARGTLEQIEDDRGQPAYILTRNHLTRQLRSLDEVSVWLDCLTDGTNEAAR